MAKDIKQVRGLSIPLQGVRLVLPDSVILQISTGTEISPVENAPSWLLGTIVWHKRNIPVLSFEMASNQKYEQEENPRVLVLKSINSIKKMPFYAFTLSGIPQPLRVSNENLSEVENASSSSPVILNEVLVDGEPVSIPNLDALEEMLISQYDLFADDGEISAD